MNPNLTEIVFVLDRSGSMATIRNAVVDGFNEFINKQKEVPGKASVSLYRFDDEYEKVYEGLSLDGVPVMTLRDLVPRGMTALNDAIGRTITSVGTRLSATNEDDKPAKVIFVVLTDGLENASKEYAGSKIKEMVEHQTSKHNWQFVFLGSNQDAVLTGAGMGFDNRNSMTYANTNAGTLSAIRSTSSNAAMYRSGDLKTMSFSDADREEAVGDTSKAS